MPENIGYWMYSTVASAGEAVKTLRVEIKDDNNVPWGTAVGSGWTPLLECRKSGTSSVFATVSGTWEDSTEGAALFYIGSATALVPTGQAQTYDAMVKMYAGGLVAFNAADNQSEPFSFTVQRWP